MSISHHGWTGSYAQDAVVCINNILINDAVAKTLYHYYQFVHIIEIFLYFLVFTVHKSRIDASRSV